MKRLLLAIVATGSIAHAHLMAPKHATVHVVGGSVFSVVWIPVSALEGVDADEQGLVAPRELERRLPELTKRLERRWVLRDGAEQAATLRLDLILQPPDDAPAGRADQIVMLHHALFSRPPREVELETDLIQGELTVAASGARAEVVTLRPPRARHRFFATAPPRTRAVPLAAGGAFALAAAFFTTRSIRRRRCKLA